MTRFAEQEICQPNLDQINQSRIVAFPEDNTQVFEFDRFEDFLNLQTFETLSNH